jgi:hypothetical protein
LRYAEAAGRAGSVSLLPAREAARLTAHGATEQALVRRAAELARTVRASLLHIPPHHASVLRAVYTPRKWPVAIVQRFRHLSPIAVRLACAASPWPPRSSHDGLERAAALHLARVVARDRGRSDALHKDALRLMRSAITAYVRARTSARARATKGTS